MRASIAAGLVLLFSTGALAQNQHEATPYQVKIMEGIRAQVARDYNAAEVAFRDAIRSSPTEGDAHCHLAEVQRQRQRLEDALASYQACHRLAEQDAAAAYMARGLLGIFQTTMRMDGQTMEAKRTALTELVRFADTYAEVLGPEQARDMLRALDAVIELDAVSAEVRQRREARAAE